VATPEISFSSDFIIGFPGETEAEFEKTMQLIEDIGFDASFSFIFSPRPGTPAADITDNTSLETKLDRLHKVQRRLEEQAQQISKNMVGTIQKVLVIGESKKDSTELSGRTENFKVVNFVGQKRLINQIIAVKIISYSANALKGEII